MDILTQIVRTLKPGEVRLIRNFYKIQSNGEIKRRLDLFDLIKNGKVNTDVEAAKSLYKSAPTSAYSHLKARLQRDILNLLLLQDSSKRYDTQYTRALFDVRRMLIEGQLLIGRGAYNAGVDILEKARNISRKYELYNEAIAINDLLRSHLGVKKGLNEYDKYNHDIETNIDALNGYLKSKDYYHRILVPNLFQMNRETQFEQYSEEKLNELEKLFNDTRSASVGYYYYYIAIFFYQFRNDYKRALEYSKKFLHLIENEDALFSSSRLGTANLQIAHILIYTESYDEAITYATNATKYFKKGLLNELQAVEELFFACFRSGDYKKAGENITRAEAHPKYNANKLIPAKWDYYKANLLFAMGDFAGANDLLIRYSELMKDRAGWLFGHKILELMCMIELGDIDIMDYRAESFRKLLQRQKDESIERTKAILKIMESFIKTGNNFKKTRELEEPRLQMLREGKGNYAWDPTGFELVRFDEWFDSKSKK
jgi:hypothetical protein